MYEKLQEQLRKANINFFLVICPDNTNEFQTEFSCLTVINGFDTRFFFSWQESWEMKGKRGEEEKVCLELWEEIKKTGIITWKKEFDRRNSEKIYFHIKGDVIIEGKSSEESSYCDDMK